MAVTWTVKGEAGKTVDATVRSFTDLDMQDVEVEFRSLASDDMTWTIWLDTLADVATRVPDYGQKITLYRNGTRYFTGWVTQRVPQFSADQWGYSITVSGPWFWLEQTSMSSEVPDQTTVVAERQTYVFPSATVRNNLIALITRAIDLGMPISEGSIASTFLIPRLSLSDMSLADAFSELMRWVVDGRIYFDYSDEESFPALCMQRRDAASTITLTPADLCIPSIKIIPRYDLKVEELKIFYARRTTTDTGRLTEWASLSAGTTTGPLPARQLVTTSGPELDLWLPADFTDYVDVKSINRSDMGLVVGQLDTQLNAAGLTSWGIAPGFLWPGEQSPVPYVSARYVDEYNNPIPSGYNYALVEGQPRDWWTKAGIPHIRAKLTATIMKSFLGVDFPTPSWAQTLGFTRWYYDGRTYFFKTVTVQVTLVKTHWATTTRLIRPEDWGWYNPPADLATNLLSTQNHVPYDGTVPVALRGDIPAGNAVGSVLNIAGFLTETSNMRAMIGSYLVKPASSQISYGLSSPDRLAFRDLISRFRQSGTDNIYWLVPSASGNPEENPEPDPELVLPTPEHAVLYDGSTLTYSGSEILYTP